MGQPDIRKNSRSTSAPPSAASPASCSARRTRGCSTSWPTAPGPGMRHRFMEAIAEALAARGIATLRYQFPYIAAGGRRPDPPPVLQATVRAAVAEAARLAPDLPLVAGGKSLGGRMTSGAQARRAARGRARAGLSRLPAPSPEAARREPRRASRRASPSRCCSCRARATSWRTSGSSPTSAGTRPPGDAARGGGREPRVRGAQALRENRRGSA